MKPYGYRLMLLPVEEPGSNEYGNPVNVLTQWQADNDTTIDYQYLASLGRNWGCNHPTNPSLQDETTIVNALTTWGAGDPIIMVGFSATAYAALSIAQRHPGLVGGVMFFDGPLIVEDITVKPHWDMPVYYGTQANFASNYMLQDAARLSALAGQKIHMSFRKVGSNFTTYMDEFDDALNVAQIDHTIRFVDSTHNWEGGWLYDALSRFSDGD